jgi:pimeloyl-ACP methyl ester carboxylesterase
VVAGTPLLVAIRPGTGAGPPLLLANGIGASLEALQPFVDALDPAITVIRFDVPGVGGSPLPARPYRFATLAWLLRGLLSKLGYQTADILGISWGGGLAQQFALSSPLRCRRLILVATATGPQTMVPGNPLAPGSGLRPPDRRRAVRRKRENRCGYDHRDPPPGTRRPAAGLPVPARRRTGVDLAAVPAAHPPAHPGARGRRRPDHPAGQRQNPGRADP